MDKIRFEQANNRLYELTLGYTCNSNCKFCSICPDKRKIDKTTIEAMEDISQAKRQDFRLLGFGGGEPTMRKDIIKLTGFAKALKFQTIRIQTNGFLLGYKDFCNKLIEAGANFFKISVHGHKAEIHDYLTQVPGSFDLILKGIGNLQDLGIRVELNIVLNKINYKFLPQYINFFAGKQISSFCIIFPVYSGNMALNQKKIGIRICEAASYIHEALGLINDLGLDKGVVFNVPYCYMKGYENHVVEKFNMKLIAPDLVVDDADADTKRVKIKPDSCKNCRFSPKCNGIWSQYLNLYGEEEFLNRENLK